MSIRNSETELKYLEQIVFKMKNLQKNGVNHWNKYYDKNFTLKVKPESEEETTLWNYIEFKGKAPDSNLTVYSTYIPREFHIELCLSQSCLCSYMGDLVVRKVKTTTKEVVAIPHIQKYLIGFGQIFLDAERLFEKIYLR